MKEDKGIYKSWSMGNPKPMVNKMKSMKLGEREKRESRNL